MFCWVSKIKVLSKSKEISSTDEIIENLGKSVISEEYKGFSIRFSNLSGVESEFRIEAGHEKILLRVRPILHPSRKLIKEGGGSDTALLVSPHIPEPLANDLRQAGIPHADLNGRLFVQKPSFLLDRRPGEIRFRNPRTGTDPFSPKASRIVRALLSHRESPLTQEDLSKRADVSRTIVSQVLSRLVEEEWVKQLSPSGRRTSARYQLADFDRLLDAWVAVDDWWKRSTVHQFSVLSNQSEEIAATIRDLFQPKEPESGKRVRKNVVFTQWFAAWLRFPYTIPPVVTAYLPEKRLLDAVPYRKVSSGGNLWLVVPEDEGVFQEAREWKGFHLASDVQIYLDLLQVEQRGPDQAAELRRWEGFAR